ncbi:LysR family transcriptional regulator [Streptosporangium sp. NPDC000239]|uniref:LysR family transcriptional regulator n=1 Tax=Streptosporangium jomthongense TaxID=1193683 RepID=A0ABV8FBJ3_9ACTN
MLDVRRLRLLRELSHRGTIAAVAEALTFTPSAVSQQLAALEREAGVALLERTGRRVALTPAGAALVRHAEAVLERLEQAAAELATARTGLAGTIRIGAFPVATRTILPAALAALGRDHPRLEPMVDEIDPAEVAPRLRSGDLDAALIHEYDLVPAAPDLTLDTEPLLDEPMYLASDRAGDSLAERHDAPWIVSKPGTLCYEMTMRACQTAGFSPRIRHHIDDFTAVLAMVSAGQGVALVPGLGAADPPGNVRLTELPTRRRTRIAFRRGASAHPALTALTLALRSSLPRGTAGGRQWEFSR